ncbi:MAG TPA: Crp/Fnr family transcriptional regulator [Candidatus Saccharimonadales bacterium]|nr:Crp/Fnr family transcriptional regulator [Candidatus Saccharimonadales bacterium]
MSPHEKFALIQQYPLFKNLPSAELTHLANIAKEKIFKVHEVLLSQAYPPKTIFLIYKGLLRIYIINNDGKVIPIRIKGPLYVTGDANLADDVRTATIEAIQETHTLTIEMEEVRRLFLTYPTFALNFLQSVIEKLRAANNGTKYYFSTPLKERTQTILQDLATYYHNREITLSQEELADIIGATRGKVTLMLQELEDQNIISIEYKKIKVL